MRFAIAQRTRRIDFLCASVAAPLLYRRRRQSAARPRRAISR